uniref:Uncharacterized protein n=1 Tax=Plectus sambesii TaxID=2011161 RepID=A0A914VH25_9BILA
MDGDKRSNQVESIAEPAVRRRSNPHGRLRPANRLKSDAAEGTGRACSDHSCHTPFHAAPNDPIGPLPVSLLQQGMAVCIARHFSPVLISGQNDRILSGGCPVRSARRKGGSSVVGRPCLYRTFLLTEDKDPLVFGSRSPRLSLPSSGLPSCWSVDHL